MTIRADGWRMLTPEELAAEPAARFGGAIAVIFFAAAGWLALPLAAVAVNSVHPLEVVANLAKILNWAYSRDIGFAPAAWATMETLALWTWAVAFVMATLLDLRSGPIIAALLFAICALITPINHVAFIVSGTGGAAGKFVAGSSQLPRLILGFVAAVGFWCYMRDGRRPNLYFRRRVRV
jgi:hypothetical protein